jgi:hypothetical protein
VDLRRYLRTHHSRYFSLRKASPVLRFPLPRRAVRTRLVSPRSLPLIDANGRSFGVQIRYTDLSSYPCCGCEKHCLCLDQCLPAASLPTSAIIPYLREQDIQSPVIQFHRSCRWLTLGWKRMCFINGGSRGTPGWRWFFPLDFPP